MDVQGLKKTLTDAGIEIYRTQGTTVQIAERVRLHIMDSGIRVTLHAEDAGRVDVKFTARAQRSDFGSTEPQLLFEKVRQTVGPSALSRGYEESGTGTVEVTDPVERTRILDVWYEVTFVKSLTEVDQTADEVRWALSVEKYVQ